MPIIGHSTIFTIGGTAALAWELPSEPYKPLKRDEAVVAQEKRRVDTVTKLRRIPVGDYFKNTAFPIKNLKYGTLGNSPAYRTALNRKSFLSNKSNYEKLPYYSETPKTYLYPVYHHEHRRTRRDLYGKIEKFLTAQNKDGKACLLKSLCQVSQMDGSSGKGTFIQEIVKAVFRIKPHGWSNPDEDDYDKAANKGLNCTEMYPSCGVSLWNAF